MRRVLVALLATAVAAVIAVGGYVVGARNDNPTVASLSDLESGLGEETGAAPTTAAGGHEDTCLVHVGAEASGLAA